MTEGQMAEFMAGTWGTLQCEECGLIQDFGE